MSEQPTDGEHVVVRPNDAQLRYELVVDGHLAGFARYVRRGGRMIFVHTEVDPAYGGRGLGTVLARGALDAARAEGVPIVPLCPFIAAFVERHPEYQDIVDVETLEYLERR